MLMHSGSKKLKVRWMLAVILQDKLMMTLYVFAKTKLRRLFSVPGPDGICDYWLKKLTAMHQPLVEIAQELLDNDDRLPGWINRGCTSLISKEGEWSTPNHRPITCLNTTYKLMTSLLMPHADSHLWETGLLQSDQRGAREGVSGCLDNLLIDKAVMGDVKDRRRNMACAWIDVRKAYDSVDYSVMRKILTMHKFPAKVIRPIMKMISGCSTSLKVTTIDGRKESSPIILKKALLQGDSLCPKLFTIYLNPLAWKIWTMEGYCISKPIAQKITQLMFIDDLKIFSANDKKLYPALQCIQDCMKDLNMQWNAKKCAVMNVKRGNLDKQSQLKLNYSTLIDSVTANKPYKFLGIHEHLGQDKCTIYEKASKEFMQRVWLIWASPLSDLYKVMATNTFAMSAISYFMTTTEWTIHQLQELDREVRKILMDNGGRHSCASVPLLYLSRPQEGRGLKSVEQEYKELRIKTAIHLYASNYPAVKTATLADQARRNRGRRSFMKDAEKYAEELGIEICANGNPDWKSGYR